MDLAALLVSQILFLLEWVGAEPEKLGAAECLERGYNSAKLLCSRCVARFMTKLFGQWLFRSTLTLETQN